MEEKKEEGTCGKSSCACKAIKGLVLLLLGGAIGFGIGRCGTHRMCPMSSAPSVQSESAPMPAATAAPQKAK